MTTWDEPGASGLMLADIARHAAKADAHPGKDEHATLARVLQFLQAELTAPTDEARPL
jgi:hypothetical protein